jgi:signal transduction histidine kinase
LSKAVKDRLFQPCIEINSNLGEVTGLGLPIASKLAKLMSGDIGCKSVVGQGSLYWFTFPAQHPRPEPAKRQRPVGQPQANPRR